MRQRWLAAISGLSIVFPFPVVSAPAAALGMRLQSPEGSVRASAIVEWENLPAAQKYGQAPFIVKSLINGIHSPDSATVDNAASSLGLLGALAKDAVPDLIELCRKEADSTDANAPRYCSPAVELAMARIGPPALAPLLALQGRGERPLPPFAIHVIANMKGTPKELRPGILALGHTATLCQQQPTWEALEALKQLKHRSVPAMPALIHLVSDPCPLAEQSLDDNETRQMNFTTTHALVVLAEVGEGAASAIPVAIEAIPVDQENAVLALSGIGRPAIPALIKTLDSSHDVYQEGAARALAGIGPRAVEAVPALLQTLERGSPRVRSAAVHALVAIGSKNPLALRAVAKHLFDADEAVRSEAADALHIGGSALAVLPEITRALEDPEPEVRVRAVDDIGSLGQAANRALPDVLMLLKDPNGGVRQTAALAIIALGTPEKEAISRLIAALRDEDAHVRGASADLLGQMGTDARGALPALKIASRDADPEVQKVAKQAIERIQTPTQQTINLDSDS